MSKLFSTPLTRDEMKAANPILPLNDLAFESDYGGRKVGDGSTPWNALPYITPPGSVLPVVRYDGAHTLVIGDCNAWLEIDSADPVHVTIPTQGSVSWPDNAEVTIRQAGAGEVTIDVSDAGLITLDCPSQSTPVTNEQFAVVRIKRIDFDHWTIY